MRGRARGLVFALAILAGIGVVPAAALADGAKRLKLPSPGDGVDLESWLGDHLQGTEVVLDGPDGASKWGAALVEALIMTPAARKIESLTIRYEEIGPDGAEMLASTSNLPALRRLDLSGHRIGDRGAEALAMSELSLIAIDLSRNELGADGVAALLDSTVTASLEWLALDGNRLGAEGAAAIARAAHLDKVRSLSLDAANLGADGAKALAAAKHLKPVDLSLRANAIGPDGAEALAGSRLLDSVTRLDLADNALGASGAGVLVESGTLRSVEWLDLSRNDLGRAGAERLAASSLPSVTTLRLSRNDLGDEGAVALAAASGMSRLERAILTNNGIGLEGARALAGATIFDGTHEVDIWGKVAHGKVPRDPEIARAVKAFRKIRRQRETKR